MPRILTPRGQAMLDRYPPFIRDIREIKAAVDMAAVEFEDIDTAAKLIRDNVFPATTLDAALYEAILELPSDDTQTAVQRRGNVLNALLRVMSTGSGAEWEINMAALFGGSWTYREYVPVGMRTRNELVNPSAEVNATDGGAALVNCTLGRSTAQAKYGVAAFTITCTAAGNMSARPPVPRQVAAPDEEWTASAWFRAAAVSRSANVYLDWYDASSLRIAAIPGALVPDTTSDWVRASITAVAPPGTVSVSVIEHITAPLTAEVHYVDGVMLNEGELKDYGDGAQVGWEWLGTAHNSVSRELTTAGPLIVDAFIPFDPNSPQAVIAELVARAITPANVVLNVTYEGGFILGVSTLGDLL